MTAGRRASNARGWGFTAEIDIADRILIWFISQFEYTVCHGKCMNSNLLRLMSSSGVFLCSIDLWPRPPGPLLFVNQHVLQWYCAFAWSGFVLGLITFVVLADSSRSSYVFGLLTLSLRILLGLHVSLVLLHLITFWGFCWVFLCLGSHYLVIWGFLSTIFSFY